MPHAVAFNAEITLSNVDCVVYLETKYGVVQVYWGEIFSREDK